MAGEVDTRGIRKKMGLSQAEFAAQFGFSVTTLRQWEQGRRRPNGHTRTLLILIDRMPDIVINTLRGKF